jgi:hypothetical protein
MASHDIWLYDQRNRRLDSCGNACFPIQQDRYMVFVQQFRLGSFRELHVLGMDE